MPSRPAIRLLATLCLVASVVAGCGERQTPTAPLRAPRAPSLSTVAVGCSAADLVAAIAAANDETSHPGADVIDLAAGCTYTLAAAYSSDISGGTALPTIGSAITIEGHGAIVERSTASGTPNFRLFRVAAGGTLTVRDLTLRRGRATGSALGGGGAVWNDGTLIVERSTMSDNRAVMTGIFPMLGGAIYNTSVEAVTISGSTFDHNSGVSGGGAIYNRAGSLTITNSTFVENDAPSGRGGVIYSELGTSLTIISSTFANNHSYSLIPGAILARGDVAILRNSIFANNDGGNCNQSILPVALTDGGGNVSWPDATCPGLNADPRLGPLQVNAPGTTATMALGAGSAAIDAAVDANCPAIDQRGVARPQGAHCDAGAYEVEVADATPPTVTAQITGTLGTNGWYRSDVTVSWTATDAQSAITSAACPETRITTDTDGQTVTCSATSTGGTTNESVTIKRDATAPTLAPSVSPNPVQLNGSATATAGATDARSGVASQSCSPVSTAAVGLQSVSCTATDAAGNTATAPASYRVTYAFSNFSAPVSGDPTVLNVAKAGQTIPLKWRILDATGAPVTNLSVAALSVATLSCALGATTDAVEEYATGNSGLQNLGNGFYQYNWGTPKTYAGSCKTLQLDLGEGITRNASFQFTK